MICGDFNETLELKDHGQHVSNTSGMRDFQDVTNYCSLLDLAHHGPHLTWSNRRDDGIICKKLDRALVNNSWNNWFPNSYCVFEAGGCSDHLRCRFHLESQVRGGKRPFKFVNALTNHPSFMPIVKNHWQGTAELFISTSCMHRLATKLKHIKPHLRELGKETVSALTRRVKEAFDTLCLKQEKTLSNPSPQRAQEEISAYRKWVSLSEIEENFLKQRSKIHWLKVGDKNNAFFHKSAEARKQRNTIREIQTANGDVLSNTEDIKAEAVRYYKNFLNYKPPDIQTPSVLDLKSKTKFRCSLAERTALEETVSEEDIKKTLFSLPSNKAPGPDGFTVEFYKASWEIIGKDLVMAIRSFFITGFLPKGINSTILALIPKKKDATEMKDYRPISCCNVLYKIISKILAIRLKSLLPQLIAQNQSAFVTDRLLMENVLLATELVKDYHKPMMSPRCTMKIDISKAFDSVEWPFLMNTLRALDFPEKFIHWIQLCTTMASFSVQVNGELAGYFGSCRGLRQGCSLSPYLFVICLNVLSTMLDEAALKEKISYHPKCKNINLTHLCFADDLLVFVNGTKRSITGVMDVFTEYAKISGLQISIEKSTLFLAGVSDQITQDIISQFPFPQGELPMRYLGLPLLSKRLSSSDYNILLGKIRGKISSWTARFLSFAGRLQLISSVIYSLINFWMSAFRLSKGCINEINKLCSAFLWSGPELNHHKAKISWENVCKPKQEGGLGIRNIIEANRVSCLKLVWRLVSRQQTLWVSWISKNIIRKDCFWSAKKSSSLGSWMWKKLLKYRDKAKMFHQVEVHNGKTTTFWFDSWSIHGRLIDLTGPRGIIDLGIPLNQTINETLLHHRPRRHRSNILNLIEAAIAEIKSKDMRLSEDAHQWRATPTSFKDKFVTKNTWNLLRQSSPLVSWYKGLWFTKATPKYAFLSWLAINNRLSTTDRMKKWNPMTNSECVLCHTADEDRNHLFFTCSFSSILWRKLSIGLLAGAYTNDWEQLQTLINTSTMQKMKLFLLRYLIQVLIYYLWKERNSRRHGEKPVSVAVLQRVIDKQVRAFIASLQDGSGKYDTALRLWFSSQSH